MIKALFTLLVLPLSVLSAWAPPGPDGKYTLTAPGITAKFIPYAASITNLVVPDRNGTLRDVILGYDNATFYPVDPNHPDYGAVPGRYPNRIANHTYAINEPATTPKQMAATELFTAVSTVGLAVPGTFPT